MNNKSSILIVFLSVLYVVWLSNTSAIYPSEGGGAYLPFLLSGVAAIGSIIFLGGELISLRFAKNRQSGNE